MMIGDSYFYAHDSIHLKDSFFPYKLYKLFPLIIDVQVLTDRPIPCIKKDPKVI